MKRGLYTPDGIIRATLPDGVLANFMLTDLQMQDVLRLRKPHPCGSTDWVVVRLGADIGLKCTGCGRRIMLTRREVARRLKATVGRATPDSEHGQP